MSQLGRLLAALFLLGYGLLPITAFGVIHGGEIGNGIMFESEAGKFRFFHPAEWKAAEVLSKVIVREPQKSSGHDSVLSFTWEDDATVQGIRDLQGLLEERFPRVFWKSQVIAGKPGFEADIEGITKIFLIQNPGRVFSISFHPRERNIPKIERVINRVQFVE